MRVLCVGTSRGGGAGIAMERLGGALRDAGTEVATLVLMEKEDLTSDFVDRPIPCTTHERLPREMRRSLRRGRTSLSNTFFTIDWPAWDIADHPAVAAADVINLHWVATFLDPRAIRRLVDTGKPVVWTLHDERTYTGGCHYRAGCEGFTAGCERCPQLRTALAHLPPRLLAATHRSLRDAPLCFVTPSHWLGEELERSSLFNPAWHTRRVIPNGIDVHRFAPRGAKAALRERLGLPRQGLGIVVGSDSLKEKRKGFAEARAALQALARQLATTVPDLPPPFVVTFGHGEPKVDGLACHHLGPQDLDGVIGILSAADVFLSMTREDNLPNTIMEAIACGLPVVATRVGGVPDMVEHGRQGWLVDRDDSAGAAAVLAAVARSPQQLEGVAAAARQRAVERFATPIQGRRYLDLFTELLAAAPRPADGPAPPPLPLRIRRPSRSAIELVARRAWCRGPRRTLRRLLGRRGTAAPR